MFRIRTEGLDALIRALYEVEDGQMLRREINARLRRVARPIANEIRVSVMSIPSKHQSIRRRHPKPQLRPAIADSIVTNIDTNRKYVSLAVRSDATRMPPGMKNLPGYMEGNAPYHRWRHPTFGSWEGKGAVQQPPHPFFAPVMRKREPEINRAVDEAMEVVRRKIS